MCGKYHHIKNLNCRTYIQNLQYKNISIDYSKQSRHILVKYVLQMKFKRKKVKQIPAKNRPYKPKSKYMIKHKDGSFQLK